MITIGYSTRVHNPEFKEYLKKSCGNPKVQIIEKVNNGEKNLSQTYNEILSESLNDIVVLCHDDIYFDTKNWGEKLVKLFKKNEEFSIIGLAGVTQMPKSGMWWEDRTKMYGVVNHEHEGKKWESRYSDSFNELKEMVTVDGLFIAVDKNKIKSTFDESVPGFHLYDVNFCVKNFINGCKIGLTTNIRVTHKSIGMTNESWEKNRQDFVKNYSDLLPLKVKYSNDQKLNVLISCLFFQKFTGSEMYVFELAKNLIKLNCSVSIVASETDGPLVLMAKKLGINVYNIKEPPGYKLGDGKWVVMTNEGPKVSVPNNFYKINEVHFDIIHCQHVPIVNIMTMLYPTIDKVCTIHSEVIDLENPVIHESIKKYISIRPEITNYITNNFNISKDKVELIYNPIDNERFKISPSQDKNYVLFVGTVDFLRKNTLIDLINYCKNENKELWIVGENKSNYLSELLINPFVRYYGPTHSVEGYIHNCSETAGILLGRTTIEGWMCGKKGWIYDVDNEGNIKSKKLFDVPEDLDKFYSYNVAQKIKYIYIKVLNNTNINRDEKKIFEYFDKTVCINLKRREDRRNFFSEQQKNLDLGRFTYFDAIDGKEVYSKYQTNLLPGELGVLISNKEIIKFAKNENLETILIVEDDCVFNNEIKNFNNLIDYIPEDWDMIYFGGNHSHTNNNLRINDKVIKITNSFAIHCVAIKSTVFDEILKLLNNYDKQIDVLYCEIQKRHNVYCFYPSIAKQKIDFSDIQNRIVDYNYLIK
jgi:hypothetical protein